MKSTHGMPRAAAVLAAILLCVPDLGLSAEQWLKLTSQNFELFTTAGEKKGRETILLFEQVRGFFAKLFKVELATQAPVRIVAFQSDKEYHPYRLSDVEAAYYVGGQDRDYIVMRNISADACRTAVHEFTHLFVKHAGIKPPLWFNEGLADLYSTLKPEGNKAKVGEVIPGHYQLLRNERWIDLAALTAADHKSPYYNESSRAGAFYAESWALVHMLNLSPLYAPRLGWFLPLLDQGAGAAEAFQTAYRKSLDRVYQDLQKYIGGASFNYVVYNIKLEKGAERPQAQAASALESGLVLAELLAMVDRSAQARSAYEALASAHPESAEIAEGLAQLAWRGNQQDEARKHFARAVQLGSRSSKAYLNYAMLLQGAGEPDTAVIPLLQKAIEMKPNDDRARYSLAFALFNQNEYEQAARHFKAIKRVDRPQAFSYYYGLAYASYRIGRPDEAKKAAERAKEFSRAPAEFTTAEQILKAIEGQPAAVERASNPLGVQLVYQPGLTVEGSLEQVDCAGDTARVHLVSAGRVLAFAIKDPKSVTIRSSDSGVVEFTCGPQQPRRVLLEHDGRPDADMRTLGNIRSLEFK